MRSVSSAPLPGRTYGDETLASRTTMQVAAPGERATMYVDFVFIREGRAVAGFFALQIGSPFPEAERDRLAGLLQARMTQEPGSGDAAAPVATEPAPTTAPEATTAAPSRAGAWTRYSDPSGVQLEHDPAWTVRPGTAGPVTVLMDPSAGVPFRRNVHITQQTPNVPVTLEEYTELSLEEAKGLEGFAQTSAGPTTLSGTPAYRVAYRATVEGTDLRLLSVWTVRSNKIWSVTYTSDPARFGAGLPDVERMIASIRLPSAS